MEKDERINKLAQTILKNSIKLKKGETVYIEARGLSTMPLMQEMIKEATKIGAVPFYYFNDDSFLKEMIANSNVEQIEAYSKNILDIMKKCDAYVAIRGDDDLFLLSDVSDKKMQPYRKIYNEIVTNYRINKTRWCVMRYPNEAFAATARMSVEKFEDFFFDACLVDYNKMGKQMQKLSDLMLKTDKVRIVAPGTHLEFSIKGIPNHVSNGTLNIPDGEVYTAPVKESINGYIQFNVDSVYSGSYFSNVYLKFEKGRIVKAKSAANDKKLQKILDLDAGSRYMGEFAIGVNPYVTKPMLDVLFDEKIAGSIHMAIGNSYDDTSNGNKSSNHWDLVLIHTKEYGGGEVWFDDVLIRKDGLFVVKELQGLNPDRLK